MPTDPHNLTRYLQAQSLNYPDVIDELGRGRKVTHWMWYIFPQIEREGESPTARLYAIKSRAEAEAYLADPTLGARLRACAGLVLAVEGSTAQEIFGFPDNLKLKSCMTLFEAFAPQASVFTSVLEKFYQGDRCRRTLAFLAEPPQQ
jgi:uncharacterized protein (DUF1810 family)